MINEFPIEFLELRDSPIGEDISEIEDNMEEFYLTIDFDEDEDLKTQCLDARNYLDSARILTRNLLVVERNKYIKGYKKNFQKMLNNLGRVNKKIDDLEAATIEKLEVLENMRNKLLPNSPKIRRYLNYLIKCMEHLVYYPLKKAQKYIQEENLDEKDKELFLYSVFVELYNSSESLGSEVREKPTKITQKFTGGLPQQNLEEEQLPQPKQVIEGEPGKEYKGPIPIKEEEINEEKETLTTFNQKQKDADEDDISSIEFEGDPDNIFDGLPEDIK